MENIRGKPGKSYRARNGACVRCLFACLPGQPRESPIL